MQRRLDQTLGKPGSYLAGIDRIGNVKPMTVGARLYRVEQQVNKFKIYFPFLQLHQLHYFWHIQTKLDC